MKREEVLYALLVAAVATVMALSFYKPHDYFTWWLEAFPVFICGGVLFATYRKFRLTPLLYILLAVHCIILLVGAHYTYAEVPLGHWAKDFFGFERNHYDRIGHIAQGFVPAIIGRELLIRTSPLKPGKWMFVILALSCAGISALYEILEWLVAVMTGEAAENFLGTQGDVWDTQIDMVMAFLGAIAAQLLLARVHDRQLREIRQV